MISMVKFLIAASFVLNSVVAQSSFCPARCTCVGALVNCTKTNQTIIPHKIPAETELLVMSGNLLTGLFFSEDSFIRYYLKLVVHTSHNTFINVKYVDISNNAITTLSTTELFIFTTALEELKLDSNKISTFVEHGNGVFQSLKNLRVLSMRNNKLRFSLEENDFLGLGNLTKLDLTNNLIPSVTNDAFQFCYNLEELRLGSNRIEFLEPGCFEGLANLKTLDLSHNLLVNKESFLFSSPNLLGTLLLNNNLLQVVPRMNAGNLTKLDLSKNQIKNLDKTVLVGMTKLQLLNLTFNLVLLPPAPDIESNLILDASRNLWNCSCSSWKGVEVNNRSMGCTDEDGVVVAQMKSTGASMCVVCSGGQVKKMEDLTAVCGCDDGKHHFRILILIGGISGVVATIMIAAAVYKAKKVRLFNLNKERKKNAPEPEVREPQSFSDRRRRTFRQIRQAFEDRVGSRRGSDIECISHHQYYSISLNGYAMNTQGYTRPDPIYSVIPDPYSSARDVQGYTNNGPRESQSTTTSTVSMESSSSQMGVEFQTDTETGEYCFPSGQVVPGPLDVAKVIPKTGFARSELPLMPPKHLKPTHKREPSNAYEIPIKSKSPMDNYIDLNR
ncbi:uncharacterized protein LOC108949710 [Ciona intestinalis]